MSETIELQTCEHCSKDANIETMTSMEGCWFCAPCVADFQKHFDACDHKWSPHVDEMGDPGQCCERCTGFVRDEDFPLLFGVAAPPRLLTEEGKTMTDVIEKLIEGDVYRWRYRDPKTNAGAWGDYHCCSRIAIVNRGRLRDTYWQIGQSFSEGRSFSLEDLPKLELERLGNFSDLFPAKEYEADYYYDSDIVNLNHSNSTRGNFYLRRGARRSREKMLEVARRNLETSTASERSAARLSEELREVILKLEADQLVLYIPTPPRS